MKFNLEQVVPSSQVIMYVLHTGASRCYAMNTTSSSCLFVLCMQHQDDAGLYCKRTAACRADNADTYQPNVLRGVLY